MGRKYKKFDNPGILYLYYKNSGDKKISWHPNAINEIVKCYFLELYMDEFLEEIQKYLDVLTYERVLEIFEYLHQEHVIEIAREKYLQISEYLSPEKISSVEVSSFEIIDSYFAKDRNIVYYVLRENNSKPYFATYPELDSNSFESLEGECYKDKNGIYILDEKENYRLVKIK